MADTAIVLGPNRFRCDNLDFYTLKYAVIAAKKEICLRLLGN